MNPYIYLISGMIGLSLLTSYVLWTWAGVWITRQELFAVRDALWDEMRRSGELDDQSHRDCRDRINVMIRIVPMLSVAFVAHVLFRNMGSADVAQNMPASVIKAKRRMAVAVANHILKYTVTGRIMLIIAWCFNLYEVLGDQMQQWSGRVVCTRDLEAFNDDKICPAA